MNKSNDVGTTYEKTEVGEVINLMGEITIPGGTAPVRNSDAEIENAGLGYLSAAKGMEGDSSEEFWRV